MTTDSMPDGDPRRLLSDVRTLAQRVRLDQRVTWVALAVLAAVTFLAIPIDWADLNHDCGSASDWVPNAMGGESCHIQRQGLMLYWPPALLLAYGIIALYAVRATRARGVGTRVMPYVLTGAGLTVLFTVTWLVFRHYLDTHPVPTEPFPWWVMLLDRLIGPAGTIGIGLLVLARLERNVPLLAFTLVYLVPVLLPTQDYLHLAGWGYHGVLGDWLPVQFLNGFVLLLGAIGFAVAARRRQR